MAAAAGQTETGNRVSSARTAAGVASGDGRSGLTGCGALGGLRGALARPQPWNPAAAPAGASSPLADLRFLPGGGSGAPARQRCVWLKGLYVLLVACFGSGPGPPGVPPAGDLLGTSAFPSPSLPYHRAQRSHAVQPTGQTPPPLRTRGVQERTGHVPPPPATPKLSPSPLPRLRLLPAPGPTVKKHVCSGAPPTGCNAIHRSKRLPG